MRLMGFKPIPESGRTLRPVLFSTETFQLEAGMVFYSNNVETSRRDFKQLVDLAIRAAPPCRAKVHLASFGSESFAVALMYPAEYDDDVSSWLSAGEYRTAGAAEGGVAAVQRYYDRRAEVLDRHQLFGESESASRTGEELLASVKLIANI